MNKAVAVKTNSFWVLLHILCFVNALINLIAFEFGDVGSLLNQQKQVYMSFFTWVSFYPLALLQN